ncbi:Methylated-DNA--protein-cysteine methyltransferase [Candidatus Syntrophocurvum alkaliphilum]|uniref:methylated-DNA--[protein]-cysteine S-methyltransferase n=1 Tax=Candidatus Syntrophocurvum alkaliphilum TaxID=2293317 RepID=A0A6I6DK26_9FIRM|nr:MGMT family protein [Candidatus Syntrophocurvum alkaliphilum]QGU00025.1 Methylated-DNA--protein-cysteine methyltransferase [Candidatus Syntrophocurvum alkaliphilum]
MCWYLFYSPWGWAAVNCDKKTLSAMVLPTPSPFYTFSYINKFSKTEDIPRKFVFNHNIKIIKQIQSYFKGEVILNWDVNLNLDKLPVFTQKVLNCVCSIPYGETRTYSDIAHCIGLPNSYRAIGQALKRNPIPLIIPCHRVLSKNGIGGFSAPGGVQFKMQLLELERKGRSYLLF